MTQIDILIPFGLPPAELSADLLKELQSPALAMLTARAKAGASAREDFDDFTRALPHETWLARRFGLASAVESMGSPPVAHAWMQSLGLNPGDGTWFVVQPIHLHVAQDHLVLTDPRQLSLPEEESRTLFDIAAPLAEETGKQLIYGDAGTWFLRADEWDALQTSSPDAASNHNIDIWMPSGKGERDWRKLQNEIQMHWFNHPLNEAREMRGAKPVNSLWLWGGATSMPLTHNYSEAFNLSGWLQGLAHSVTRRAHVRSASELIAAQHGNALLTLDALQEHALANDWGRWLEAMRELENIWFGPLHDALKSGALDALTLILTNDKRIATFTTTRPSLRKFWVKPSLTGLRP
ncbi:MAG TPA: hypothetical protein VJ698_22500 [Noviherbaspirillum sp.]|uniref:hypothetical protein n=1 Tax=Noviherbaspirillum sp. TaxID=1926288 RepID=UPI002B4A735D|nr:hypothetical protein [Noviherbaspirillum sp.]HJV88257.1 hypothetical protein [Noviherbaspirillum sp.]